MNHALSGVRPNSRPIWRALTPFLLEHMRYMVTSQVRSGILVSSKMVPLVTLNWRLQALHLIEGAGA